ncbi:MAG: DUF11 domain-containing protein, partial [Acidobacteria bacterium]|nr:DUF11 domain-containing protein [Acidobacteriota bacterium]
MHRPVDPFGRISLRILVSALIIGLVVSNYPLISTLHKASAARASLFPPAKMGNLLPTRSNASLNPAPSRALQGSSDDPEGGAILIGESVSGMIDDDSDADVYQFQGIAGESVRIEVNATSTTLDPAVTLFADPAQRSPGASSVAPLNTDESLDEITAQGPFSPGDVFTAIGNGKVKRFSPTGTLLQTLDSGSGSRNTAGMGFDAAGNLYVTQFQANSVFKFDIGGNLIGPFGSGYDSHPESVAVDLAQNIYVGQADGSRQILKFNSAGTSLDTFSPATERRGTDWIDLAADQRTLFYTSEGKQVKRFDLVTKTQLPDFNSAPLPGSNAYALRILPGGGVIVADWESIVRLDASGNVVQTYDAPGDDMWFAVNLDPDGQTFWSGNFSTGQVYRFNIATGAVVASWNAGPFTELGGLAVFGEITAAQVLTISKRAPASVNPGASLTYTITYGNSGATAATNVVIKDTVPAGTTFISATDGGAFSNGVVTWNIGTVNAGVTGRTVSFTVGVTAASGTIVNDNYTIQGDGIPPVRGAAVTTTIGQVVHDDNSGGGVNALIPVFQLPFTGIYTVLVASSKGASSGGYELVLNPVDQDSNVSAVSEATNQPTVHVFSTKESNARIFSSSGAGSTFLGFSPDGA